MASDRESETGASVSRPGNSETPESTKRSKKACTECRQQKVRCNASTEPQRDCDRCQKLNLHCVISDPFKRTHKRNRLSELEHETEALRRRLGGSDLTEPRYVPVSPAVTPVIINSNPLMGSSATYNNLHSPSQNVASPAAPNSLYTNVPENSLENSDRVIQRDWTGPTLARCLDAVQVSAADIDAMFHLFFDKFSPFLPILDPQTSPNEFYSRSPFLFWAVIGVSSIVYAANPTILQAICPKVIELALSSLKSKAASLTSVQGLLILMTWPLPRNLHGTDTTFPLTGAMIHMAMQIGLHLPFSTQDFSKVKVRLSADEINKRAELWLHCVIAYSRKCNLSGLTPTLLHDAPHAYEAEERRSLTKGLSLSVRLHLKMLRSIDRCYAALSENGLRSVKDHRAKTMDILIRIFEAEIRDLGGAISSRIDEFYLHISKLNVQVFHLYKDPAYQKPVELTKLFNSACVVLKDMDALDREAHVLETAPHYFFYGAMLASVTILRLLKSSFAQYTDFEDAKASFFLGVNICKRLSIENNDVAARLTVILKSLWNSDKAFKNPDGSECISLRIRTRLAMSPVYDAVWWYKEEFQGFQGTYQPIDDRDSSQVQTAMTPNTSSNSNDWCSFVPQDTFDFFDDQLLAEWTWSIDNDPALASFALSNDRLTWNPETDASDIAFPHMAP